jgi:asparagine synthase (glutamine-hydrolysing)
LGRGFAFASEQKALLTLPGVKKELNLAALKEYFTFQNIFTCDTFFNGVSLFPAAHYAYVNCAGAEEKLQLRRYWDYRFEEWGGCPDREACTEELRRLFVQAVKRQMVSDAPLGSYLSGGIDSGAITAIAAGMAPYISTFTCGFDLSHVSGMEAGFDERENAELMSYLFKTEHYEMVLKAGDMERCISDLVYHVEDPRVGQSYPNYYIAKLASKFVKVVLAGSGGDELFGGYPWRYYRAIGSANFESYIDQYYAFWQRLVSDDEMPSLLAPVWRDVKDVSTKEIFRAVFGDEIRRINTPEEYINHSMYFEVKTFLHGLLIVDDKISMAHGMETRVPFLDNDLVEFAMRLPVRYKLKNIREVTRLDENERGPKNHIYYKKTKDGKLILREAMRAYIPGAVIDGVKQGFSAPDASWFRNESLQYIRDIIETDTSLLYTYLDRRTVRAMADEHFSGKKNRRLFIWSILNFEYWCRNFLG